MAYGKSSISFRAASNFALTIKASWERVEAMLPCSHNKTSSASINRIRSASCWALSRADSKLNRMAFSCVLFMATSFGVNSINLLSDYVDQTVTLPRIALVRSEELAPSTRRELTSRSMETEGSPASILATRDWLERSRFARSSL